MNRLRDLREDEDLRQIDVARAAGPDQKTLSNYKTDKANPDSEALIRLADFFGVSIDYLVGRGNACAHRHTNFLAKIERLQRELEELKKPF